MDATDVLTAESLSWMREVLPPPPARLLEIGCGAGRLAATLGSQGWRVVAQDADPDAAASARELGVEVVEGLFPDEHPEGPFDAVLFTRSLHHVEPLAPALARVRRLLAPTGLLVVEDWAWEEVDRRTAVWAYGLMDLGKALGFVPQDKWSHLGDPLASFLEDRRGHGIHPSSAVLAAAGERFELSTPLRGPYFFRLFARHLDAHPSGAAIATAVLQQERSLAEEGVILPAGLAVTGIPRNRI